MKRRQPNRSRRIVKKLLQRADEPQAARWDIDAVHIDGGKRWVTAQEMVEHNLMPNAKAGRTDHG